MNQGQCSNKRVLLLSSDSDDDRAPVESRSKTKRKLGKENQRGKHTATSRKRRRDGSRSPSGNGQKTSRKRKRDRSRSPSENGQIILELKKTNDIMTNLSKRMKGHKQP